MAPQQHLAWLIWQMGRSQWGPSTSKVEKGGVLGYGWPRDGKSQEIGCCPGRMSPMKGEVENVDKVRYCRGAGNGDGRHP